jgi:hypothetical protein
MTADAVAATMEAALTPRIGKPLLATGTIGATACTPWTPCSGGMALPLRI